MSFSLLPACQREQTVLRYKPFFTNVSGAEFRGTTPVDPDQGYIDPTLLPSDAASQTGIIENPDGSRTLLSRAVRQMMGHVERCLNDGEDALLLDQVISEKTIEEFRSRRQDPAQIVNFLKANRKDISRLFARMPMGEHTPTVILSQVGDKTWVLRLTGTAARDMKFTRLWTRLEAGNWKFMWVD